MRAVWRLLAAYFFGSPLQRWMTATALAAMAVSFGELIFFPHLLFTVGPQKNLQMWVWQSVLFWLVPIVGIGGLFFAAAPMPEAVWHFARSRLIHFLPYGRLKLLCSALVPVALVALAAGALVTGMFKSLPNTNIDLIDVFQKTFVVTFLSGTVTYGMLWIIAISRSAVVSLIGGIIVTLGVVTPLGFAVRPDTSIRWPLIACVAIWAVLFALFLNLPRLKVVLSAVGGRFTAAANRLTNINGGIAGHEVELLIGTSYPWTFTLGQVVPVLILSQIISAPSAWLYCLTILGAISGATTSVAVTRSRALWLRTRWSRPELFGALEALFWRRNGYVLGTLLLLLVGIGVYLEFPVSLLAAGIPLLLVVSAATTYLGLMMTRSLGWIEILSVIGMMVLLAATVIFAARKQTDIVSIAMLEGFIALVAIGFRFEAKRRWTQIDWLLCPLK